MVRPIEAVPLGAAPAGRGLQRNLLPGEDPVLVRVNDSNPPLVVKLVADPPGRVLYTGASDSDFAAARSANVRFPPPGWSPRAYNVMAIEADWSGPRISCEDHLAPRY
jgi:hypothetical protein